MKKVFLLFAALLAPILALYGQEKTEWIYKMYGEHSIMKKTFFFAAALLCVTIEAAAQDTLCSTQPKGNYFANFWPEELMPGDTLFDGGFAFRFTFCGEWDGVSFIAEDSLKIYGIAINANVQGNYNPDTLFHLAYLTLQTVDQTPTGKQVVGDDLILFGETPPTYYWYTGFYRDAYPRGFHPPKPMYELYYKHPITVCDSFLLGGSQTVPVDTVMESGGSWYYRARSNKFALGGWWRDPEPLPVFQWWVSYMPQAAVPEGWEGDWETLPGGWISSSFPKTIYMIFPILTPNPDTTHYVPDDSTQTGMPLAAWERYVAVQPNPATDKATVLSSVGLTQVEVFDMAGNRVLRQEVSGLSAKVDVAALPRGTYIVRIHTPMGTTSRKLLLQ
jgi:hypothetical protein